MAFMGAVPDKVANDAVAIQTELSQRAAAARGNGNLSSQGIQSLVAQAYLRAKTQMDQLQAQFQGARASTVDSLSTNLFGAASSVGADAISARDADDRASQLETPDEASRLLERAEVNGDQVLARAIALRAYAEQGGVLGAYAWSPVLDAYVGKRPAVAAKLDALTEARRNSLTVNVAQGFIFSVDKPSELNGLSDTRIQAAADADLAMPTAAPSLYGQLRSVYGASSQAF